MQTGCRGKLIKCSNLERLFSTKCDDVSFSRGTGRKSAMWLTRAVCLLCACQSVSLFRNLFWTRDAVKKGEAGILPQYTTGAMVAITEALLFISCLYGKSQHTTWRGWGFQEVG